MPIDVVQQEVHMLDWPCSDRGQRTGLPKYDYSSHASLALDKPAQNPSARSANTPLDRPLASYHVLVDDSQAYVTTRLLSGDHRYSALALIT